MSLRAVEHIFNGATTPIASYDSTKTNLGTLMIQKSGTNPEDNFVGPLPVAIARPMEESTAVAMMFPHAITYSSTIDWVFLLENTTNAAKRIFLYEYNKSLATYNWKGFITATTPNATNINRGFRALRYLHTTGTVAVAAPVSSFATGTVTVSVAGLVTHSATGFLATMVGKMIGFGSTNVAQINCWYPIVSFATTSTINILGASSAYAAGTAFVIADCTVTGTGTAFRTEGIAAGTGATAVAGGLGPRIGFGSTDPTQITTWYHIGLTTSDTSIGLTTPPGVIPAGTPYVIEELRFAMTLTNSTVANGGFFLLKGAGYHDFTTAGSTFPSIATAVDDQRGVYWLSDAGTPGNVVTNQAACGLAIDPELNKGLHYAYVLDGIGSTFMRCFRYNMRGTGTITAGKMTMSITYTTSTSSATTVTVSGTTVTASGAVFNSIMVGERIAFNTTSIANVTIWYTIASFTSTTVVVLSASAGTIGAGAAFIIDTADVISTSPQLVTGTVVGVNNGRIGTLLHGPGINEKSLYFVTTTRIYRAAVSKIFDGNLGWISDNRPEIPTGSASTFPATGSLNMIEIADAMDRLIVLTTGNAGIRQYVTRYPIAAGDAFDHIWGVDVKQQDQSIADPNIPIFFNTISQNTSVWSENGIAHIIKHGASALLCHMYALPLSAHTTYAASTNQRVITPAISTPNCASFKRLLVSKVDSLGSGRFIIPLGAVYMYYRISGITGNTGEWTLLPRDGDLYGVAPTSSIQFMFEFEAIGMLSTTARIMSLAVIYEDLSTDSRFQPSSGKTVEASKQFAWRFSTAFGSTVPTLRVRLYDAVTGGLILDDTTTSSTYGTWEKSTDGTTFGAYNTTNKTNETTYIRYTPTTLPDNTRVRSLLTLN
ncbi:MAG: hypothetical protein NTV02_02655 [Candidatus Zambryskibacteria bacterium]|nr:hypothetical protein [Candidatus Zambryskibacteria bacterium]